MKGKKLLYFLFAVLIFTACGEKKENPNPSQETPPPAPSATPKESVLLSEYETKNYDPIESRTNNLILCAKALEGHVIPPGAEFSFNDTVGPRTPEKGYEKAITFDENGEKKKDYGGGICQISSALHMAAKKAGLEITERHDHKQEVPYEETGNDAAICYGALDLKFINNQDSPIRIQVTINGEESVLVKLYKI